MSVRPALLALATLGFALPAAATRYVAIETDLSLRHMADGETLWFDYDHSDVYYTRGFVRRLADAHDCYEHDATAAAIVPALDWVVGACGRRGVIWGSGERIERLRGPGVTWSEALQANADGLVVGSLTLDDDDGILAYVWSAEKGFEVLPHPSGDRARTRAFDLTATGVVVGEASQRKAGRNAWYAAAWHKAGGRWNGPHYLEELGAPASFPDSRSAVNAVTDDGLMVGYDHDDDGVSHATAWVDGQVIDLGLPARATGCEARSVNPDGLIGGYCAFGDDREGFLWRDGGRARVDDLLVPGQRRSDGVAVRIEEVYDIDADGTLNAFGPRLSGGALSGFLLVPEDAPLTIRWVDPLAAGVATQAVISGASPSERIHLIAGSEIGTTPVPGCPGLEVPFADAQLVGSATSDAFGVTRLPFTPPAGDFSQGLALTAVDRSACTVSQIAFGPVQ